MQKKILASLARNTVLACSDYGHGDLDSAACDAVVVLDTETLWTHRWGGGHVTISHANPMMGESKLSMGSAVYGRGVTGYLALCGPAEVLVELAGTIDLDALPRNARDFTLPDRVAFKVVHPRRVVGTWAEREETVRVNRERQERAEAHRREGVRQRRAEMAYVDFVADKLGIDFTVPADMIGIRLLERIARAEGVALPERPEHLRDVK